MHFICSCACATAYYAAEMVPLGTGHLDTLRAAVANDASVMSHCVKIVGLHDPHLHVVLESFESKEISIPDIRSKFSFSESDKPSDSRRVQQLTEYRMEIWSWREHPNRVTYLPELNLGFFVRGDFLLPCLARAIQEDSSLPDLPSFINILSRKDNSILTLIFLKTSLARQSES